MAMSSTSPSPPFHFPPSSANWLEPADVCTLPPATGVTCVSWSPKGKQIVAGKRDGSLTQYKPDLKEAKVSKV